MSSDLVQSIPSAVVGGQGATQGSSMGSGEPNWQAGGLGLQRTASKDLGSALPGLQRTMSRDMGAGVQQPVGGGLQRTMSRDMGGAGAQPGGLQRTMSRDVGAGPQPGGLQRTMSRDLGAAGPQAGGGLQRTMSGMGGAQPGGGGGLQRTMSKGLGNVPSRTVPRDGPRQPRKTGAGKTDRVPRSAGGQDPLPRHNTASI